MIHNWFWGPLPYSQGQRETYTFPLVTLLKIGELRGKTWKLQSYLCTCTHVFTFIDVWHTQTCRTHVHSLFMDMHSSHFPNGAFTMSPDCSVSVWAFSHSSDHLEKVAWLLWFSHWYMGQAPGTLANCKLSTTHFPHGSLAHNMHILFGCIIIF